MKKFLIQIMFLMLILPGMSQAVVYINGTITDTANGNPIPNHEVYIVSDSSYGYIYYNTVYTNLNGFYSDTVPVPSGGPMVLYISTYDYNNLLHQTLLTINPVNLYYTVNFQICNSTSPCQADFIYYLSGYLTAQFTDYSTGGNGPWSWNFGDGGTSPLQNPSHSYSYPGQYLVTLAYGNPNSSCYDTKSMTVYLNDTTGGGCNAAFTYIPDSVNTPPYTYQFIDQSTGNIIAWMWNFGDPSSGIGNFSNLQNPTHSFMSTGNYLVCLTVQGADSSCYDVTCNTVIVGSNTGCQANFTYSDSANTSNPTQFIDLSQSNGGGPITSWNWNFGDPPSGTNNTSNVQNPVHLFSAPGSHTVCLTIHGADSSCYDVICKTVIVGSNTGCQADFTYYPDSTNIYMIHFIDQSAGNIISWSWNFGDGSPSGAQQNPIHVYPATGSYTVCLTIHGADSSCYDVTCKTVIVGNNTGCQAMFTYYPDSNNVYSTIHFIDQSTGNPGSWMWNFGDSTFSTEQNPVHVYPGPGVYLACLTITANNGTNCTSTFCLNVFVNDSVVYHQIYGQVFEGNFPLQLGLALIFSLDSNLNYAPYVDVCSIDSNGVYYFTMVPDGNYLVYAIPLDSNGYLPTYYGNVINWQEATLINLGTPNNPYNINLVQAGLMVPGPGSVSGQVNMSGMKSSLMDKMTMLLMDEAGHAISFDRVSESGSFNFPTMDYGTYYLYAEMSGITSDYVKVILTPEKPHADVVMTFAGRNVLGINNRHPELEAGIIYPNPAIDKFNLALNLTEAVTVKFKIFNQMGQIASSMVKSLGSGQTILTIPVSDLTSGIYTLRIASDKWINITRKLLIAK